MPFYLKSMVYRQHTIYEYTWLRVSLSQAPVAPPLAPGGEERIGKRNTRVAEVANTTVNRTAIDDIQQLIAQLPAKTGPTEFADAVRAIDAAFSKLGKLRADHLRSPDTSTFRNTGNYVERVSVVDYDAVYYLNGRIPPFGSNSMSAELGPDGTLAKAASDAKGGVGEAITAVATAVTGVAPIKEFVASKWMPTAPDAAAVKTNNVPPALRGYFEPGVLSFRVELETDIQGYVFDFRTTRSRQLSVGLSIE
ncbi:MAG: hypothetical protein ABIT20_21635 [Gemmatimonadaceae bacterium]